MQTSDRLLSLADGNGGSAEVTKYGQIAPMIPARDLSRRDKIFSKLFGGGGILAIDTQNAGHRQRKASTWLLGDAAPLTLVGVNSPTREFPRIHTDAVSAKLRPGDPRYVLAHDGFSAHGRSCLPIRSFRKGSGGMGSTPRETNGKDNKAAAIRLTYCLFQYCDI